MTLPEQKCCEKCFAVKHKYCVFCKCHTPPATEKKFGEKHHWPDTTYAPATEAWEEEFEKFFDEEMKGLREMTMVAIGQMEAMWRDGRPNPATVASSPSV